MLQAFGGTGHGVRLVGNQPQQAGLRTYARQVLAQVVVQGLGQASALLVLDRQQGLGQPRVLGLGLLQGGGHGIEMRSQLARLGQPFAAQAHIEPAARDLLQGLEQLIE